MELRVEGAVWQRVYEDLEPAEDQGEETTSSVLRAVGDSVLLVIVNGISQDGDEWMWLARGAGPGPDGKI